MEEWRARAALVRAERELEYELMVPDYEAFMRELEVLTRKYGVKPVGNIYGSVDLAEAEPDGCYEWRGRFEFVEWVVGGV
jgi:hypothetical protein